MIGSGDPASILVAILARQIVAEARAAAAGAPPSSPVLPGSGTVVRPPEHADAQR